MNYCLLHLFVYKLIESNVRVMYFADRKAYIFNNSDKKINDTKFI